MVFSLEYIMYKPNHPTEKCLDMCALCFMAYPSYQHLCSYLFPVDTLARIRCVANDVVFVRTNTASRIYEWVCLMTNDEGGRGQQNINGRDYRLTIKKIQPNEYFGLSCTFFFWRFACWEWIVPKLDGINKHVLGADLVLEAGRYIFYIIKYTAGVCLLLIGGKCA